MADHDIYKLHIEDIQEIRFALPDFDLLYKGLEEYFDGDSRILSNDAAEVAQHELSNV